MLLQMVQHLIKKVLKQGVIMSELNDQMMRTSLFMQEAMITALLATHQDKEALLKAFLVQSEKFITSALNGTTDDVFLRLLQERQAFYLRGFSLDNESN